MTIIVKSYTKTNIYIVNKSPINGALWWSFDWNSEKELYDKGLQNHISFRRAKKELQKRYGIKVRGGRWILAPY